MSNGTLIDNPCFLSSIQTKIKKVSKQKRRKQAPNFKKKIKASKRWKKASKKVALLQCKASNQRLDWAHKVATQMVMLSWALGTNVLNRGEGSSTSLPKQPLACGGMKQLASMKRQKHLAQSLGG